MEMGDADLTPLRAWLPRQRWFAGKGEPISSVELADRATLPGPGGAAWWLIEVRGAGGGVGLYQIPVTEQAGGVDWDGLAQPAARRGWLELLLAGARIPTDQGELRFEPLSQAPAGALEGGSRLGSAEQSNTSILYQDAGGAPCWVLKLFRRVMPGENPEFEIPRALAAQGRFPQVPAPAGRVRYRGPAGEFTLATLQPFIANRGDGWSYVLERLRQDADPPALRAEVAHWGRRTAEMHLALAALPGPDFAPEPVTAADGERWRARARAGLAADRLRPYAELLSQWRARLDAWEGDTPAAGCAKVRIHGDYHLGQILVTEDDIVIFDFEGEPARPIPERRQKGSVLQDVAGMLRSFSYAAHAAGREGWEAGARQGFLDAYRATLAAAGRSGLPLVPAAPADFDATLKFFEGEKAVYELGYELAHRPDWVEVPLAGLRRLFG